MEARRRTPRFVVFGAGAVGSVFAARLAPRFPVAVVARGARLETLRRDGLVVRGATEARVRAPAAGDVREAFALLGGPDRAFDSGIDSATGSTGDFVLVAVKATETAAAAAALRSVGSPPPTLASLQNGLGNEETLAAAGAPVIGAVSNHGAILEPSGTVLHAGTGDVILGAFRNVSSAPVEFLSRALGRAGLPARVVDDIRRPLWEKAILNAAVNPPTALLGLRTGELLRDPGRRRIVRFLVEEATRVADAEGIAAPVEETLGRIEEVAARTAGNRSSMLQDLERGRRTEIEAITGVIVERAEAAGIDAPWNRLMLRLVRAEEAKAREKAEPMETRA